MVDIFKEKFELFALTETKLKGNREVSWCGVNVISSLSVFRKWKELEKGWPSC